MTYETIDWDAEAKRVARAFDISPPVHFVPDAGYTRHQMPISYMSLHVNDEKGEGHLPLSAGLEMSVSYHSQKRFPLGMKFFYVFRAGTMIEGTSMYGVRMELNWDGSIADEFHQWLQRITYLKTTDWYADLAHALAKGLFHLNLLTPEIEAALEVSITAHQKIEWALEYEERYGL